ncbi:cysteine hydrolase [soil metagenome]
MPKRRSRRGVGLVLIDVINGFDFEGAEAIARAATRVAPCIEELARRARAEKVPVIYVNDNFGRWRSDFRATVRECTRPKYLGSGIAERLRPAEGDYFVLKPQHSGFYSTALELLLDELHVHTVVLTGFAANLCVLFTANDAHMRGYNVVVPSDCTASNSAALTRATLLHVSDALHGSVLPSPKLRFGALAAERRKPRGQTF